MDNIFEKENIISYDKTGISYVDLKEVMGHLEAEGCLFKRNDALGWKIGLKKAWIEEKIKNC